MNSEIILGSLLLGLLSCAISIIKKPRFFWGSAAFDPISFFWIIAFFLYGPIGALISSIIGSLAIAFFSRETTPALGAVLKFTGTLTVWLTFYLVLVFSSEGTPSAGTFSDVGLYASAAILAAVLRCVIEIPACYFAIPYFLTRAAKTPVTAQSMLDKFGGIKKYLLIMTALNFYLTVLDTLIPWLIVYPTGMYAHFGLW